MTKMGRYRYWGDQKPDTSRPLLTVSRPQEAVTAAARTSAVDQPTTTGTLRIYGPIDSYGGWWGVSAKEVAQALDLLGAAEQIIVRVNSPGGESSEGRAIVNLLRAHKAEIVTVVDGAAYSAASYIAACGDDTVMSPGTTMMIHDTSTFFYGNEAEFRKVADTLGILSDSGAELYAEIAGGTPDEWRARQKAETWYTAATAVEAGLMKRVATVPDSGVAETAGDAQPDVVDPNDVEERARASYDLSLFDQGRIPAPLKPPTASAGGTTQPEGAAVVDLNDTQITALREQVGFPADADADTIVAAVVEALGERAETPNNTATPQIPEGMALVDSAVLAELRQGATDGRSAAATLATQERDRQITEALAAGKIAATSKAAFETRWEKDPEGTKAILESLTPGLVPTEEIGTGDTADDSADAAFEAAHAQTLTKLGVTKEG